MPKYIEKSLWGYEVEPVTIDEFTDSLESILDRDFGESWDYQYEVNDNWVNISLNIPYNKSSDEIATDDRDHYRNRCNVETCEYCKEDNNAESNSGV